MDIVVTGPGSILTDCRHLLARAGFQVADSLAEDEACPVILGDLPHLFSQALELIEAERHVLIANPLALSASQLATLIAARKPRQAVFLWSDRRQHPAHRLVNGLVRSDETAWRPRYLRQLSLTPERPTSALLRWRASESLALTLELARREPLTLTASSSANPWRGSLDFLALALDIDGVEGFVQVGLGEGLERRETTLAANDRKAYIDELNAAVPVRLVDDGQETSRAVSCASPGATELARLQCLSFLEATTNAGRCQAEADLWLRVIGCWQAVEASLAAGGAPVDVREPVATALRVISGRGLGAPASPTLKIVS